MFADVVVVVVVSFSAVVGQSFMNDLDSKIVLSLAFLPNCGNKYFVAAVDDGIKIFDFETEEVGLACVYGCCQYL